MCVCLLSAVLWCTSMDSKGWLKWEKGRMGRVKVYNKNVKCCGMRPHTCTHHNLLCFAFLFLGFHSFIHSVLCFKRTGESVCRIMVEIYWYLYPLVGWQSMRVHAHNANVNWNSMSFHLSVSLPLISFHNPNQAFTVGCDTQFGWLFMRAYFFQPCFKLLTDIHM